ncbi:MAG TPA: hypothetical protein VLU94_00815 [Candidatus Nitrosotalea sp.]|nr:hypothetical protein [Candidatus Nitrosotalea sp.]
MRLPPLLGTACNRAPQRNNFDRADNTLRIAASIRRSRFQTKYSSKVVDSCILYGTVDVTMLIQFPFVEVPKELRPIVGEPTPHTRAYRREGTYDQCREWYEALGEHFDGDVGLSPSGVSMFVPVTRAAVHKRIREGKLTAFAFYVTKEATSLFGSKRKAKQRPYIFLSVSECRAWAEEMKRKAGYVDDPALSPAEARRRLGKVASDEEPRTRKEADEANEFVDTDPKDRGNRKVKYQEPLNREDRQSDVHYMVAEALASLLPGKLGQQYRKRLENGLVWDKKNKKWKWKE